MFFTFGSRDGTEQPAATLVAYIRGSLLDGNTTEAFLLTRQAPERPLFSYWVGTDLCCFLSVSCFFVVHWIAIEVPRSDVLGPYAPAVDPSYYCCCCCAASAAAAFATAVRCRYLCHCVCLPQKHVQQYCCGNSRIIPETRNQILYSSTGNTPPPLPHFPFFFAFRSAKLQTVQADMHHTHVFSKKRELGFAKLSELEISAKCCKALFLLLYILNFAFFCRTCHGPFVWVRPGRVETFEK